jgi:hypothetical protein
VQHTHPVYGTGLYRKKHPTANATDFQYHSENELLCQWLLSMPGTGNVKPRFFFFFPILPVTK